MRKLKQGNNVQRPLIRYHGGKFVLAPWIISHFPQHKIYVEGYGGAASVLLQKPRCYQEIYNDMDEEIVNLFQVCRNSGNILIDQLKLTPFSRTEFEQSYDPGGVFFIAARPGMGKTAFVIEMIVRMASKFPIGFINLEMSNNQIVQRIISNKQKIDNDLFKLSKDEAPDWLDEKIQKGMNDFVNLNLQLESKPGLTIEGIKSKAKYWKAKFGIRCLFIDYLQIIEMSEERQRYHNELENLNYTLAQIGILAKELEIPIIVLSQLNREMYKRGGNKEPEISDMKGSGKIEEIAYQIAFLHRPEYFGITEDETGETTKDLAYFMVKKHREGKLAKLKFKFEGQFSHFGTWDMPMFTIPGVSNSNGGDDLPF